MDVQDGAGTHHRTVLPCEGLDVFPNRELGVLGGEAWRGLSLWRALAIWVLALRPQLAVPW